MLTPHQVEESEKLRAEAAHKKAVDDEVAAKRMAEEVAKIAAEEIGTMC